MLTSTPFLYWQIADDNLSFNVKSTDGQTVTIRLPEPVCCLLKVQFSKFICVSSYGVAFQLTDYISGLIEIQGVVTNKNDVECTSYVLFPNETSFGKFENFK